jgi:transcriptional regulator with XRE-family HTH domain
MRDEGLTQVKLAELVNVDVLTVWRWKKGKSRPQLKKLRRLSQISGGRLTADSFPLSA